MTTPTPAVPSPPDPPVQPPKPPVQLPLTASPTAPDTPPAAAGHEPQATAPTASGEAGGPAAAGTARRYGASSRIATISRFRASRPYLTTKGPSGTKGVWITFWLSRPATVVFLVDEVAPACRHVGRFLVRGRAGRNSVPFRGRLRGRTLDAGTYRLTAHPRRSPERRLTAVTVVILEQARRAAEVDAERARNACPGGVPPSLRADTPAPTARKDATGGVAGVSATGRPYEDEATGPLAATADTIEAVADAVPPVLVAFALLAVLLLGVAAMPQPVRASRAGATLVHHRGTIALAGFGVLIGAVLSFALL